MANKTEFISAQCLQYWQEDEWFAAMRLMGQNPMNMFICSLPLMESDVKPLLEGDSLDSLLANKRLFIIDLAIMEGISTNSVNGKKLKVDLHQFVVKFSKQFISLDIKVKIKILFIADGPNGIIFHEQEQNTDAFSDPAEPTTWT